ncbi:MAG: cytochrome c oxidase subunit II [Schleiferiaceae bacterium]|nr:cytochrome c oxidase subunit II [Schleiferiaceae bacterium]MDG1881783.1 cytochrome c oxidase subunit II [Schleiferiaceae bacterium]
MTGLLIAIVLFLLVLAIAQIIRIYELATKASKRDEYVVTNKDNNYQGRLMLLFGFGLLASFVWMVNTWSPLFLPKPSSLHGVEIDMLWDVSMGLIVVTFFIVQPILFFFAYKYRGKEGQKATYYEHNNKLEFVWTIVPAIVLAVLIVYGMTTWSNVWNPDNDEEPIVIELYAQQFKWIARYSGDDNTLGNANVRLIQGVNTVGVDTMDVASQDDIVVSELHLPVGRPIKFLFRSQDVIHSAYMPHFRAQMNCVPGAQTSFQFTPTITTEEIRTDPNVIQKVERINKIRLEAGKEFYEYDYLLLCNKVCGSAHYNMQMPLIVETQAEYAQWLSQQKTVKESI